MLLRFDIDLLLFIWFISCSFRAFIRWNSERMNNVKNFTESTVKRWKLLYFIWEIMCEMQENSTSKVQIISRTDIVFPFRKKIEQKNVFFFVRNYLLIRSALVRYIMENSLNIELHRKCEFNRFWYGFFFVWIVNIFFFSVFIPFFALWAIEYKINVNNKHGTLSLWSMNKIYEWKNAKIT